MNQNFIVASVEGQVCICQKLEVNDNIKVNRVQVSDVFLFGMLQTRLANCKKQLQKAIEENQIISADTIQFDGKEYPNITFVNTETGYIHHYNQASAEMMEKVIEHNIYLEVLERKETDFTDMQVYVILDQYKKAVIFSDLQEETKLAYLERIAYIKHAIYRLGIGEH